MPSPSVAAPRQVYEAYSQFDGLAFEYLRAQALDMEASSSSIHRIRKEL